MVSWFGVKYDAAIYDQTPQVPAPENETCRYCDEAILAHEDGFIDSGNSPFHRACFIRLAVGSVSHQTRMCSCYVGSSGFQHEPEYMTRREAAEEAESYARGLMKEQRKPQ